jgi:hypothetical protein
MSLKSMARSTVNRAISKVGLELVRAANQHDWNDTRTFIPLETTLRNAKEAGLSVGDYIDTVMNKIPGATQKTIDEMTRMGVFAQPVRRVLEIGPGSGRYLEKTMAACHPEAYEIYETAAPWAKYVTENYPVLLQPTDGRSLAATADASIDLVQAHKVFSGIPFLPTCLYWAEMARVARPRGYVVFDIISESCLDESTLEKWLRSEIDNGAYPAVVPRAVVTTWFGEHGLDLVGTAMIPIGPGTAELFVFRKR